MVRRRKILSFEDEKTPTDEISMLQVQVAETKPLGRVSRRLIAGLVVLATGLVWFAVPHFDPKIHIGKNMANLTEFLLETSLHQYLPDGKMADELIGNLTSMLKPFWFKSEYGDSSSPGIVLKSQGAKAHFPVILIPGITSTGLELWEGKECAKPYFRERLWGTLTMLRSLILDGKCWMEHMRLDPDTGGDPAGIRIRPAQGLEAADFLLPGFWVWARIIANLAELGYDHSNLMMAAYDWRLNIVQLEQRDHYLTKLKNQIELLKKINGKKVVVITHSLGASVWQYFMKWVEADIDDPDVKGGKGGPKWISEHIESIAHIGGTFLGAPKSLSAIISGESRETAMLGKIETYFLEMFLSRSERVSLFRSWSGGLGILPKGGNLIWGGPGILSADHSYSEKTVPLVTRVGLDRKVEYYADNSTQICAMYLTENLFGLMNRFYSTGVALSRKEIVANDKIHRTWMNPLESQLPYAPELKIYCMHGIGKGTERGYMYEERKDLVNLDMAINTDASNPFSGDLHKGVFRCEGDGTVPLLSLGYMGLKGWRQYKHLNPSKIPVVVREYKDDVTNLRMMDVRGGPSSGDHVDILGNHALTMDLLRIVTNFPEGDAPEGLVLKELIISNIGEICEKIDIPYID